MKGKRSKSTSAAFTLVEVLIGATLSAAIMAAVLSSYIFLGRNLGRLANQQTLERESRRALAYFAQDVQSASGISSTPSVSAVTLTIPSANSTTTVAYAYDSAAGTLTRTAGGTSLVLVRNIVSATAVIRYYDTSGNPYDSGSSPYTTITTYSINGIKQLSLQFNTQTGTAASGTRTIVNQVTSGRLAMRNKGLLQ